MKEKLSEGIFIEFKRQFPTTDKVARAISALAITHGGYFIVGIEETPNGLAHKADGYDSSSCSDPMAFVRNACRDYLSPFPNFSHQIIEMNQGKRISVIRVPSGDDGAHIHKDGRVYVRKADCSDPVHLSDRITLDRIYEKQERSVAAFKEFAKDDRVHVSNASWLNIFISPKPLRSVFFDLGIELADYEKVLKDVSSAMPIDIISEMFGAGAVSAHIPFSRIYRSGCSIYIEQSIGGSVQNCLTLCIDNLARVSIHIPINMVGTHDEENKINTTKVLQKLYAVSGKVGAVVKYYDAAELWQAATHLLNAYCKIIDVASLQNGYQFAVELVNAEFWSPYVDDEI